MPFNKAVECSIIYGFICCMWFICFCLLYGWLYPIPYNVINWICIIFD